MEIKIGSKVCYRPCFGMFPSTMVKVKAIEKSDYKRCKYGFPVDSIPFEEREYCVFVLDNGHWCYGEQIDKVCPR